MNWTREKPTAAGWYWWRQEKGMMEVPREVVYSPFYRGLVTQGERLIAGDGEWLGPITPDSYQQGRVADWWGLIRDIQKIRDSVENGIPPEHRPGFQRGCNEIIGLVLTYQKHAQAAQDEKGVGDGN